MGRMQKYIPLNDKLVKIYSFSDRSWGSFQKVNWPKRECDHSLPPSAKVKNKHDCTSAPHTCIHRWREKKYLYIFNFLAC
jgi:hypothetical protein